MLRRVALVRTNVSEERIASIIGVTRIGELGTLAVTSNRSTLRRNTMVLVTANVVHSSQILVTLMMEAIRSSETSVFTRATWRTIPADGILHSHCRENHKSYIDKKLRAFYGIQSSITVLTRGSHWCLARVKWIRSSTVLHWNFFVLFFRILYIPRGIFRLDSVKYADLLVTCHSCYLGVLTKKGRRTHMAP
jgi:hypothetical protein